MADDLGIVRIRIETDRYPHLINTFKIESRKRTGRYSFEAVKTRGRNKEDRIMRIAAIAEDGLLWLRRNMGELENEMYTFPNGTTDDIIDALAWHILDDFKVPRKRVIKEGKDYGDNPYSTFSMDQILDSMNSGDKYATPFESAGLRGEKWADERAPLHVASGFSGGK